MTDDKAGQVQSELSARGTKRDVENTTKCIRPNCILTRRSSLGPPPGIGPSAFKELEQSPRDPVGHFDGDRTMLLLNNNCSRTNFLLSWFPNSERLHRCGGGKIV